MLDHMFSDKLFYPFDKYYKFKLNCEYIRGYNLKGKEYLVLKHKYFFETLMRSKIIKILVFGPVLFTVYSVYHKIACKL